MPALYLLVNFPVYHCIARSFVLHASVHSWWSQEPSGTWSIATIEVALSKGWEIYIL